MMLRGFALVFAIVFITIGIAGFVPSLTHGGLLFNLFEVGLAHNIFYILIGLIALSASASAVYAKRYFKFFGIIFGFIAILGFALNGNLRFLQINLADSFFYLIVAIIAIYLGYTSKLSACSR